MKYALFINYRRDDSISEARLIKNALVTEYGAGRVFMDVESIELGDEWPKKIKAKLERANVLIAVIGPEWLRAGMDEWGRRRIDQPKDWVRLELEYAFRKKIQVLPLLVRGGKMPPAAALPRGIRKLASTQAFPIRSDYWDHEIKLLMIKLATEDNVVGTKHDSLGPYPKSKFQPPEKLREDRIARILKSELRQWAFKESPLPENPEKTRTELFREFKFHTFADAIRFMNQTAAGCDAAMHHPRWENIFKTLRVYLSTWDGGMHAVTDRDVQLAHYLDWAFRDFYQSSTTAPKAKKTRRKKDGAKTR